ncbi:MAG: hypothetical protein PHY85_03830 [Bacteroidales bacterium]|nr:hypothetical protein [Bacteroidales bacterium]
MKNIILPLFFLLIALSCEKPEDKAELITFPIKYCAINNGSNDISRINLESITYYPNEHKSIWLYSGKSIYDISDMDTYLNEYDSIIHSPEKECYIGCIVYLNAIIFKEDSTGTERRLMFEMTDTIKDIDKNIFSITWPNDSSQFCCKFGE